MSRSFIHLELNTGDTRGARSFYRHVFQWEFNDVKMGDGMVYTQIKTPSGPGGGMQVKAMADAPSAWMPYIGVPNIPATLARVKQAGGAVVVPYQPVPGFGALAIVEDPTGAHFGLWETVVAEATPEPQAADAAPPKAAKKKTAKKAPAEKKAAKKETAKKETAKKKTAKKKTAKKKTAKKQTAKKQTAKKTAKKQAPAKKAPAKKTTAKKKAAKKATAKKTTAKKTTAKKTTAKKAAPKAAKKKSPANKKTASKGGTTKKKKTNRRRR
jgi:predicted enzyme related to lactoylglutathione lyase